MAGKLIVSQKANEAKVQIDMGNVARGTYMVTITSGSEVYRTKVTVQ